MIRSIGVGILLMVSAHASIAASLRAHYQLNVLDGSDVKTIQFDSNVMSGVPVVYDIGKYTLTITIITPATNDYVLKLALTSSRLRLPVSTLDAETFTGHFSGPDTGPLEIKMQHGGLKVTGAIALSLVDR